ncbi:unnamed protein product, partial [Rotaria sp. Silwood2]
MFLWDYECITNAELFCPLRGYIHHVGIASIHHSLVLQAIQKYCRIKNIKILDSSPRKICLVFGQWIFDFGYILPIYLTNNISKLPFDNACLISISRPDLLFSSGVVAFFVSDIIMAVLYRRLIKFVRQASQKANANQMQKINRDVAVFRRITLLNFELVILGIPALIVLIVAAIHIEILPKDIFRILLLFLNTAVLLML